MQHTTRVLETFLLFKSSRPSLRFPHPPRLFHHPFLPTNSAIESLGECFFVSSLVMRVRKELDRKTQFGEVDVNGTSF